MRWHHSFSSDDLTIFLEWIKFILWDHVIVCLDVSFLATTTKLINKGQRECLQGRASSCTILSCWFNYLSWVGKFILWDHVIICLDMSFLANTTKLIKKWRRESLQGRASGRTILSCWPLRISMSAPHEKQNRMFLSHEICKFWMRTEKGERECKNMGGAIKTRCRFFIFDHSYKILKECL